MVEQIPNQDLHEGGRRVLLAAGHARFVCPVSIRQIGQSGANEPMVRKLTQQVAWSDGNCEMGCERVESNGLNESRIQNRAGDQSKEIEIGAGRTGRRTAWLGGENLGLRTHGVSCHVCEKEPEKVSRECGLGDVSPAQSGNICWLPGGKSRVIDDDFYSSILLSSLRRIVVSDGS
jgi:hypothetical protein